MSEKIDWNDKIRTWEHSGKTKRAFCKDEGLSYWTFRDKLKDKKDIGLVRIKNEKRVYRLEQMELIIDGRIRIQLCKGYSGDLLRAVLSDIGVSL